MSDVDLMIFQGIGEDEDIVEVDHYEDVSHVSEDVIHEGLDVAGALVSPMGITRNSNEPYRVRKAVFHSWPAAMRTL